MNSIEIFGSGIYLPKKKVENKYFNDKFNLSEDWILKRTGINNRYWSESESILDMSIKAVQNLVENNNIDIQKIGCIIVASTTNEESMPGISFKIQKELDIKKCICMDISAGCSGYINGLDIIRLYIALGEIEYGLVIGVEKLSSFLDEEDIGTSILLGDGAGATLIGKSECNKKYIKNIESIGQEGDILTCKAGQKIYMDGKKIYKFATIKVYENIKELIEKNDIDIDDIKYIIPHQSNIRIIDNIEDKLEVEKSKVFTNIKDIGNTFNASIPIAIHQMMQNNLLNSGDKVILVGYGGGLNLGSILLEI